MTYAKSGTEGVPVACKPGYGTYMASSGQRPWAVSILTISPLRTARCFVEFPDQGLRTLCPAHFFQGPQCCADFSEGRVGALVEMPAGQCGCWPAPARIGPVPTSKAGNSSASKHFKTGVGGPRVWEGQVGRQWQTAL